MLHQEALSAKKTSLKNVMNITIKVVNTILSNKLNHQQFKKLLEEAESQYGDIVYFCPIRCLNRVEMLSGLHRGFFFENF